VTEQGTATTAGADTGSQDGEISDLAAFHELVGQLDYPMLIVTTSVAGERSGCLVGFHTQCSIDPPRFLVCISRSNHTFPMALASELLAVHVLDAADCRLAELFGEHTGDEVDKFAACAWRVRHRLPVLSDVKAWFVGRVLDRVDCGDHIGHLLEPIRAKFSGELRQLGFQQVKTLNPGHPS
jgi:flavin reductase (DIM6/NTAB) family NADH-FMN oxidoreductase RutF